MNPAWAALRGDGVVLSIVVQPRASRNEVAGSVGDRLKLRIAAPPVDGAANAEVARFLAKAFGVPRARVEVLSGRTGRAKRIAIHSPNRYPEWLPLEPPA